MSKARASQTTPGPSRAGSARNTKGAALALLFVGASIFAFAILSRDDVASGGDEHASHAAPSGEGRQYRYFADPEDARPFPATLSPSRFRNRGVARSYEIAQEIPEVLAQQPCLCGCDNPSDDHRSLLDCFSDGHASTCMICIKEAVFASQKTAAGESGEWIRNAILRGEFSDVSVSN